MIRWADAAQWDVSEMLASVPRSFAAVARRILATSEARVGLIEQPNRTLSCGRTLDACTAALWRDLKVAEVLGTDGSRIVQGICSTTFHSPAVAWDQMHPQDHPSLPKRNGGPRSHRPWITLP